MMKARGLAKLVEECGELTQVAAKRIAYPRGKHPDEYREKPLNLRLEEEIADVLAAAAFVVEKLKLDKRAIEFRRIKKLKRFRKWDKPRTKSRAFDLR